jgi:hypothetical protein
MKIIFGNDTLDRKIEWLIEGVGDIYPWFKLINRKLDSILANQDELNDRAARLSTAVDRIEARLAEAPVETPLDFSSVDAQIARAESAVPAEEAPSV